MPTTLTTLAKKEAKAALQSESRIATWKKYLKTAGLDHRLYTETKAWDATPEGDETYEPQMLAALQAFTWMFGDAVQRAWIHLAAEMQAGKSGVVNALIRLVLQNFATLKIAPSNIFVLTGMSDDAWRKQTRVRLPREVRANVHHSGGLGKVQAALTLLKERGELRNLLIIIDESQVAAAGSNRPNALVYETIRKEVPPEEWVARNIRFMTVSATYPAKVMSMATCPVPCRTVRLQTTKAYQSVESLKEAGRIRSLDGKDGVGNIGSTPKSVAELKRAVASYATPRYHILRPPMKKTTEVETMLRKEFPECDIRAWDSSKTRGTPADEERSEDTESLEDINDLLAKAPAQHTFILLKNMFYAAKTMDDRYVGVLWDRTGAVVGGDNARLQSLLGRACGYGKSKDTIVYTSMETVTRYLTFWRELCRNAEAETLTTEHAATKLHRKMPGVSAVETETGAKVVLTMSVALPTGIATPEVVQRKARDATVEMTEVMSLAAAKSWAETHLTKCAIFHPCDEGGKKGGERTHFKYRGGCRRIETAELTRASNDLAWGQGATSGSARIMPVAEGFVVVYKPVFKKTA